MELEAVPESESDGPRSTTSKPRRPRANTLQSESSGSNVPKVNHSHHSVLKHQHAQRKQSQQFVAPRHPISGAGSLGLANRSVDNLPQLKDIHALHSESHIKDSIVSAKQEQRQIRSEHTSPILAPSNLDPMNSQLSPLDFNNMSEFDLNPAPMSNEYNYYPEVDNSLFPGLGAISTSVDWSHYDGLDFNNFNGNNNPSFAISNYSLAPSYNGYDFNPIEARPALTTTSASGDLSEVEDGLFMGGPSRMQPQKYGSDYNADPSADFYNPMITQNYSLNQNQNFPPPAPSNSSSNFDLDEILQVEREMTLNTGFPATQPEKTPQSYDAFTIPADEADTRPYSPYYNYTTPPNSAVSNPPDDKFWPL